MNNSTEPSTIRKRNEHRFAEDPETGCWIWNGPTHPKSGYPMGGSNAPHRRFYGYLRGGIPEGHDVHHKCQNKLCVNPLHMEALDAHEHRTGHWLERAGMTPEKAEEIRRVGAETFLSFREIGARYGISEPQAMRIVYGQQWTKDGPSKPIRRCVLPGCDEVLKGMRGRKYCRPAHAQAAYRLRQRELARAA